MSSKAVISILRVLEKHQDRIIGSRVLSEELKLHGVELTERTIRYHMRIMDEKGLTKVFGKEGRKITEEGLEELANSQASEKVGFIISKIETLSYQTDFDLDKREGNVILNISFFPKKDLKEALKVIKPLFSSPYVLSDRVVILKEGDKIGDLLVPDGKMGLGTVCSVTINGIFLKAGIPITSKYGGLLQVDKEGPLRFVALISYEGSSLDPLLVFIKSGMTSVSKAARKGAGNVLASFREMPVLCIQQALDLKRSLEKSDLRGILTVGHANQPLLGMPVGLDRTGVVVVGGLNPVAAMEEAGIRTDNRAMAALYEYSELLPFGEASKSVGA
jgi:repressor of nif and glnA expression